MMYQTKGQCANPPTGCGKEFKKEWSSKDEATTHVRVCCPTCFCFFMAVNTPIPETEVSPQSKVVTEQEPLSLYIEYTITTTHEEGDPLPIVVKKPTGRVRRIGVKGLENWFTLSEGAIDRLLNSKE